MKNKMETQNYFYRLINPFGLSICLWMINRENEEFDIKFNKNLFPKSRYKFNVSVIDNIF